MPLPWLSASQGSPGSLPSGWSAKLFQEAPREGEGPAIVLVPAFSSHPLGKREQWSPARAHLPSTAQEPNKGTQAWSSQTTHCNGRATISTGPSQPSKEDAH